MHQPLRLLRGEMLYSDVRHIYGPLSPYLNATLYRLFGTSLDVLYANGAITTLFILALVYWIARQLMGRAAAAIAALEVLWLCAFKQAGNYILPYSYSALHACALGLATLAILLKAAAVSVDSAIADRQGATLDCQSQTAISIKQPTTALRFLILAGLVAGLTILAKTEMGLAALVTGVVTAWVLGYPQFRRSAVLTIAFLAPAILLTASTYGWIATQVGWHTLAYDNFLFFQNLPAELIYYNKRMSGFDAPLQSLAQMLGAALRIAAFAGIIATLTILISSRRKRGVQPVADEMVTDAGKINHTLIWFLLTASLTVFIFVPLGGSVGWDKGPYLAIPVLLAGLLIGSIIRFQRQAAAAHRARRTMAVLIVACFALASLARVMLRVRSGGAYSSYLLPASVILFTYFWTYPFTSLFRNPRTRRIARNVMVLLMLVHACGTGVLLAYRYRTKNFHTINTPRGTMLAGMDIGVAMNEAIEFVKRETQPGEPIAVMPEGTSLNFFTDRPNPLREEITTPGFLNRQAEAAAIERLIVSNTRFIFITNRATSEFGPKRLGEDYHQTLMQWVETHFEQVAIFGPVHNPNLEIGDRIFFIRAYRKRAA